MVNFITEKYLKECIFPFAETTTKTYDEMRKEKIYTAEIDALMKANIDGLEAVGLFFII